MVAEAKKRGSNVPTTDSEIRETFGIGWWKFAPDVAEQLLLRSGFKRDSARKWIMPNGQPFKLSVLSAAPEVWPLQARLGAALASKWREFGIDSRHDVNDLIGSISAQGRYDVAINWPIETWGGLPDLHRFLQYWHSDYYKPIGETTTGRNMHRWKSKELDAIVDEMNRYASDSDKTIELGQQAMKLLVREMPIIPMVGQNQLDPADTYYWENWPTAKNPYAYPLPSGGNYRVVFPRLKATGRK
jgi:peptide/nickel transport system substrate-binding protein